MRHQYLTDDHEQFRASFASFVEKEMVPHASRWDEAGIVDRELFAAAGSHGFLGFAAPIEDGGGGVDDFRFNQVISEELHRFQVGTAGTGLVLQNDVCLPYFVGLADEEQRKRWLPGICSGELVAAIAMTEPGAGSDLAGMRTSAIPTDGGFVLNGSKTFITNGINADVVIVAAKTDPSLAHRGISLLVVERGMPGFERGRNLDKLGMHAQDTAELFFDNVHVPAENLLGTQGAGFAALVRNLAQERLSIAVTSVCAARAAFELALAYCTEREAFGRPIADFQNTRFRLAEMATEVEIGETFVDRCVEARNRGTLTPETAAMAKYWCTELQGRVVDTAVQLHGGYGFMVEQPVARLYADARASRIFGGTNEIMREVIGRSLVR
ncbi:MAG TPA: acyl-CoA dehydrogenase family protein [Acidimicrobiales bacterium]|nr:acyl-CoA dehydrogenase family protein [Acidimicrobiales bacterium]